MMDTPPEAPASRILYLGMRLNGCAPRNVCRQCGSAAYRPVLARDATGAMRPSGQYQCARCRLLFSSLAQWRLGGG